MVVGADKNIRVSDVLVGGVSGGFHTLALSDRIQQYSLNYYDTRAYIVSSLC